MKRLIIMGVLTIALVLLVLFMPVNSKNLGVFEDSISLKYISTADTYWELALTNNVFIISDKSINENIYYWKFTPQGNGNTIIALYNRNKSDDSLITTVKYEFKAEGNKIIWISGEATGITDFPNPY